MGGEGKGGEGGEGSEGKRREGKGREGRRGQGEGQSSPLCVCVFVCAHVGAPHNVPLVCLTSGGSLGSSPLGAPQGAGLAFPPQWPITPGPLHQESGGRQSWGFSRRLAGPLPPHTARHMTG